MGTSGSSITSLRAVIWLAVEATICAGIAAVATLVIAGIRTYYGPWADPPGTNESWWALFTVAVGLAAWRFVRRSRRDRAATS